MPALVRADGDAEQLQGLSGWRVRCFDRAARPFSSDQCRTNASLLSFSERGISFVGPPIYCLTGECETFRQVGLIMLFLSKRFSSVNSATTSLRAEDSKSNSLTSGDIACRAVSLAKRFFPVLRKSFDQKYTGSQLSPRGSAAQQYSPHPVMPP